MEPIDHYIERRNALQLAAENADKVFADSMWARLGVANRHIERVLMGQLQLTPAVVSEIERCLQEAERFASQITA